MCAESPVVSPCPYHLHHELPALKYPGSLCNGLNVCEITLVTATPVI